MPKTTLPSVDDGPAAKPQQQQQRQQPDTRERAPVIADGYLPRRVDVKLPMAHRKILRDKLRILQDAGARLKDGTEVSDKTKVILWILENEVQL